MSTIIPEGSTREMSVTRTTGQVRCFKAAQAVIAELDAALKEALELRRMFDDGLIEIVDEGAPRSYSSHDLATNEP